MKISGTVTGLASIALISLSQCRAEEQALRRRTQVAADEVDLLHYGFESRIVGGTVASANSYQYNVNLGGCGGSLIHEDIVLTAAHCQPLYPDDCRIGGNTRNGGVQKDIVGNGTPHPAYNERSQDYDFMLYKLASPVRGKTPIALNRLETYPSVEGGDPLTVIGFGSTFEGGSGSFRLMEAQVNHVNTDTCNVNYRDQVEDDIMFCAGVTGGGIDTCQGDSGGPIIAANGQQVGVTSWGNGCAREGFPGVYARVSAVYGWIQEQICEMSSNPPASCLNSNGDPGDDTTDTGAGDNDGGDDNDQGDNTDTGGDDNDQGDNTDTGDNTDSDAGDNSDSDLVQPKGISIRIDITYDEYPHENAWVLYNDETKEELFFSDYGDVDNAGLQTKTFTDLVAGKYVFLMIDEYWDGICCRYGQGKMQVYQVFPQGEGRGDELKWDHNGRFWNAAGAVFVVEDDDDRRSLRAMPLEEADMKSSPYVPQQGKKAAPDGAKP